MKPCFTPLRKFINHTINGSLVGDNITFARHLLVLFDSFDIQNVEHFLKLSGKKQYSGGQGTELTFSLRANFINLRGNTLMPVTSYILLR